MMDIRPRIAVPLPTAGDSNYNDRCWKQYEHALAESGASAVCIPLDRAPAEVARLATSCCGVLLPGSPADIQPQKYGEERRPETSEPDLAREAVDELLLQDAFNLHKPIFGICYGHQAVNVWLGGSLDQHLSTGVQHEKAEHTVLISGNTLTAGGGGAGELAVNSSHHQAVGRVGDGLEIVAVCAADETIEAIEGRQGGRFLLGVQWHPERSYPSDPASCALFERFVAAAREWQQEHGAGTQHS
jgi:putative glutamine amidotransferase